MNCPICGNEQVVVLLEGQQNGKSLMQCQRDEISRQRSDIGALKARVGQLEAFIEKECFIFDEDAEGDSVVSVFARAEVPKEPA